MATVPARDPYADQWTFGGRCPRSRWVPYLFLSRTHCSFQWCGLRLNYWQTYRWDRRYFNARLRPFPQWGFGKFEAYWVNPAEPNY